MLTFILVAVSGAAPAGAVVYGPQETMPFTGLSHPDGVAVDVAGTVYVAGVGDGSDVVALDASGVQTTLPFTGLDGPVGVAVDAAGTVYATSFNNNQVMRLPRGGTSTIMPFTDIIGPAGVAVDAAGVVYVVAAGKGWAPAQVVALTPDGAQRTLPFTGLGNPWGIAVDAAGTVYVAEPLGGGNGRVVALATDGTQRTLPFTGLGRSEWVTVDAAGTVYVSDINDADRVVALAADGTQSTLPFTGLDFPTGVAVDTTGAVYVADSNDRVVKIPVTPPVATTTTVSSAPNPSMIDDAVTLTATVSPAEATGAVAFTVAGTTIAGCDAQPLTDGTATCTTTLTTSGTHAIVARYLGDEPFVASTSPPLAQTVNPQTATSTALAGPVDAPVVGQAVTFTATVTPPAATGTVTFTNDGNPITGCTTVPVAAGEAPCPMMWTTVGSHTITAAYAGDTAFLESHSNPVTVTVAPAATTLRTLRPSHTLLTARLTAVLTNAHTGAPLSGQTVRFRTGGATLCVAVTNANGTATCTTGVVGKLAIVLNGGYTAGFAGTADYLPTSSRGAA